MKNRVLALIILFLIPGCDLNEEILDEVSGDNLIQQEGAEANLAAPAYAYLNLGLQANGYSLRLLNENVADERVTPTRPINAWNDGGVWKELHQHSWTLFNNVIINTWQWLDQGVGKANTGLYYLDKMDPKDEVVYFMKELRFLRAFYRFWQLDLYRQASMRSERDLYFEQVPEVAKGEELFMWLVKELNEIIPLLRDRDHTPYGRITKAAAKMLLSKIYLNAEVYTGIPKWEESLELSNEIISTTQYSINPDYFDIFGVDNHNNSEAIFVIRRERALGEDLFYFTPSWVPSMYRDFMRKVGKGWNGPAVVSDFVYTWDEDSDSSNGISTQDKRFYDDRTKATTGANLGFVMGPQFHADGLPVLVPEGLLSPGESIELDLSIEFDFIARYSDGTRVIKYEPDLQASNISFGNNDFMIFRYADLWLMAAEAKFRLGKVAEALSDINTLREIRGAPLLSSLSEQAILDERGFELYWEGWRRQDLIRFDQFTRSWANKPQSDKYREVFPIPPGALASNSKLIQNPGY